jgi:hypothetical protein
MPKPSIRLAQEQKEDNTFFLESMSLYSRILISHSLKTRILDEEKKRREKNNGLEHKPKQRKRVALVAERYQERK